MLIHFCLFPVIFLLLLLPPETEEIYGHFTSIRLRAKIVMLDMSAVKFAINRIDSIQHIKRSFLDNTVFQMGELVHTIRDKYKRMTFLLNISERHNLSRIIVDVVECQQLSLDIDKLIHMMEEYEWKRMNTSDTYKRYKFVLRTKVDKDNEKQKNRETLRSQMAKIRNSEKENVKIQKHFEDGFDTD